MDTAQRGMGLDWTSSLELIGRTLDAALTDEYLVDTMLTSGTVNAVVDKLLAFRERVGPFGTLLYCGHDWGDAPALRRSMQLMAEEVLPRVNRALGET